MLRARPSLLSALLVILLFLAGPVSAGGGEHTHEYGYGDVPGNPLIQEDAARCLEATKDDPSRSCIVLYGHIFSLIDSFLSNTQRPPPGTHDLARGFSDKPNIEPWYDVNELEMFSSPGFVEYQEDASLKPKVIHRERGITADVTLAKDIPVTGYWHLSVDLDELAATDPEVDLGVAPCITVQMAIATGQVFDPANTIARGATTKTLVNLKEAGEGQPEALGSTPCPGATESDVMYPEAITEFEVDMGLPSKDIPKLEGFVVFVEWYAFAPTDPDADNKVAGHGFNIHTGSIAPNRVVVAIEDAVRIEELRVVPFAEKLFVQAVANSPWGSYDVDPTSLRLTVTDAAGESIELQHLEAPHLRYDTTHAGHFNPVTITWPWDHGAEHLPPGTYRIAVSVQNWQHTGQASGTREVVIEPEHVEVLGEPPAPVSKPKTQQSPAPWALVFVLGVAAALQVARRRTS